MFKMCCAVFGACVIYLIYFLPCLALPCLALSLIVSSVRCIYAYFNGNEMSEVPNIPFEYNQLIELIPGAFQCSTRVISPSEELKNQYMSQ